MPAPLAAALRGTQLDLSPRASWACSMSRPIPSPTAAASSTSPPPWRMAQRHGRTTVRRIIDVGGGIHPPGGRAGQLSRRSCARVLPVIERLVASSRCGDLGRHQQARSDARRRGRRRRTHQRCTRPARTRRARRRGSERLRRVPDAHAGGAGDHAARAALQRCRGRSACFPERARGGLRRGRASAPGASLIDPGFGFGKTVEHNLALLRRLAGADLRAMPVLVGLSRKSTARHTHRAARDRSAAPAASRWQCSRRSAARISSAPTTWRRRWTH